MTLHLPGLLAWASMELQWHKKQQAGAGGEPRPLVVLLPWVGARPRDVLKYVELVDR